MGGAVVRLRSRRGESGVAAVEYGLLVAVVAVALIGGLRLLGSSLGASFDASSDELAADGSGAAGEDANEGEDEDDGSDAGSDGDGGEVPGDDEDDPSSGGPASDDDSDGTDGEATDPDADPGAGAGAGDGSTGSGAGGAGDGGTSTGGGESSSGGTGSGATDGSDGGDGSGSAPDDSDTAGFTDDDVTLAAGSVDGRGANWDATVTITVQGAPEDAEVAVAWVHSRGDSGDGTCELVAGQCSVSASFNTPPGQRPSTVEFLVTSVGAVEFADGVTVTVDSP